MERVRERERGEKGVVGRGDVSSEHSMFTFNEQLLNMHFKLDTLLDGKEKNHI